VTEETASFPDVFRRHRGKVSDKWSSYLPIYERLLAPFRRQPISLLEIGIQNGGSLEIYAEYFSRYEKLVGCDISKKCAELSYGRDTFVVVGDCNADETLSRVTSVCDRYDIIIDDGSHKSKDIIRSFLKYFPLLKSGGVFIIEDLHASYWRFFEGGLYYTKSSMSFLKLLADVVNEEHWGNEEKSVDLLRRYFSHLIEPGLSFPFSSIVSVEFCNSLCIIRKGPPDSNGLGPRHVCGDEAIVAPMIKTLDLTGPLKRDEGKSPFANFRDHEAENDSLRAELETLSAALAETRTKADGLAARLREKESELAQATQQAAQLEMANGRYAQALASARAQGDLLTARLRAAEAQINVHAHLAEKVAATRPWRAYLALGGLFRLPLDIVRNPQVRAGLLGYIRFGKYILRSSLFDEAWYLAQYPDVRLFSYNPAFHYFVYGGAEGRDPSAAFSSSAYLAAHPEAARAGVNPLLHHELRAAGQAVR
jgi:SAM-dependent methyltransferase